LKNYNENFNSLITYFAVFALWLGDLANISNELTPRSRDLLKKLTGSQLFKKSLAFCGTRRFITVFTMPPPVPIPCQLDLVHTPHILLPEDPS